MDFETLRMGLLKTDMDLERPGVNLKMPRSVSSNAKKRSLKKRVDLERSEIEAENGCRRPGLHLGVALEKLELEAASGMTKSNILILHCIQHVSISNFP